MDLFVEKYRPQSLEGFIGDNTVRDKVQEYLKEGIVSNKSFKGLRSIFFYK
jgi:hypothetical protein